MASESFNSRRDEFHRARNEDMVSENAQLTLRLRVARDNCRSLEAEVGQLVKERVELITRLQDAVNEINRLSMVVKRQKDDTSHIPQQIKSY